MKNIIFIIFYTFASISLLAQTTNEDLKKLVEAHAGTKNYHYQLTYSFYGEGQNKPIETVHAIVQQFGAMYYHKMAHLEQVSDKKSIVTINSDEKYVITDKAEKYETYQSSLGFQNILSDMEDNGSSIQLEQDLNGLKTLKGFEEGEKTPSWTILYDKNTFQIVGITLYFDEEETDDLYGDEFKSSKLEIKIKYLALTEPILKVATILNQIGNTVSLKAKYKNYTLYDQSAQQ